MKRKDLIEKIENLGCVLIRYSAKHNIYHNPQTGMTQPIPSHREINEVLAKKILLNLSKS
jgi:mRNA interferase HicA